ncbi:MAG TPA: LPD7 domain-containing protein [Arsenophonus apicola]|uniref:LPD7 domain-containing protein n=2 Tax=Arsenophonus TaxID=637 RepID=UPI0015D83708|nr:LPD7 domain-containing protein [Arsenophonus endosymbiont of Apis mellifera]
MLIRVKGYNDGGKEYLEEGKKNGRDLTREELDDRVILYGDLDLTQIIYRQIPDKGQERYVSFTLSFREEYVANETLLAITQEFKDFLMYAYEEEEYNFYAEAHIPKIKFLPDQKTGKMIERKPHIHILVPRKNLLSGREMNPSGWCDSHVSYFEAFQEYINQKYQLQSPREHVRINPTNAAEVLSRYKGDDFLSKNRDFKKRLVTEIVDKAIHTRHDFYNLVADYGDTRIRNKGKENEYIAVKLPGDTKFTNLKETIFQDDFIVRRELKKTSLDKQVIQERLMCWPQRAKEIKYVSKASSKFIKLYQSATPAEKRLLLAKRQIDFYEKYRGQHELHPAKRQNDHQRSLAETQTGCITAFADGLQSVSGGHVAAHRHGLTAEHTVFLPGDAHFHVGQSTSGRSAGLRSDLSGAGRRRKYTDADWFTRIPSLTESLERAGYRIRAGIGGVDAVSLTLPPYALNCHAVATFEQIQQRGERLFQQKNGQKKSTVVSSVRRVMPKTNKNASHVAAYFLRRATENRIEPAHRYAIHAIDNQFFTVRRTIMRDARLTRKEKSQFLSVLTFERLKAHHAIRHPNLPFEMEKPDMNSKTVRQLIPSSRTPDNSISGAVPDDRAMPAKSRFELFIRHLQAQLERKSADNEKRAISAFDLYTKRAKLSKNVHFLDKKTDRTLFVDTGNAITVRKAAMTDSAIMIALTLAKEKFGSTLTIKGSQKFKDQIIEVVAKNNLDIHFTDKGMNQQLAARKAELAIEKTGQRIERPNNTADTEKTTPENQKAASDEPEKATQSDSTDKLNVFEGYLVEHGAAPFKFKPDMSKPEEKRNDSYFVKLQLDDGSVKTLWGVGLEDAVAGLETNEPIRLEDKGVTPVKWTETQADGKSVNKSGERRIWQATPIDRHHENETETPQSDADYDGPEVA